MIRVGEESGFSNKVYYRYTCEKCGFHSHWITYMFQDLPAGTNGPVVLPPKVSACLEQVRALLSGKRAASRDDYTVYNLFKKAETCPRCGHVPSWMPVQKLFSKGAEKYNRETPMLSEPEVVFCGRPPAQQEDLLVSPCKLNILHAGELTETNAAPAFLCLNGKSLGSANGTFAYSATTSFGDNVLTVENSSSVPLLTFYFCAQSGAEMRIRYGQRQIVIEDVKLPETTDTEQATAEKTPEAMTARELIALMRENAASDQFVRLGYRLTQKLEENFFTRPEDIKEALLAFGDSGMAERFEMIRQTMKPSDLGLLMPDLLGNYMKRHS
ncbi:MAG: hypothetical protein ABFC31_06750 [Clostridiaceae bacterium]